jgi:hypothetical protein
MTKGWKNETQRHKLAKCGVKTKITALHYPKDKVTILEEYHNTIQFNIDGTTIFLTPVDQLTSTRILNMLGIESLDDGESYKIESSSDFPNYIVRLKHKYYISGF